jgi:ferrochelatase
MLLVNFGGPRDLAEVEPFLIELLTDPDLIRTNWPRFLHRWFFTRVARKRAVKIRPDYALIGGASPIYADTEEIAKQLESRMGGPVIVFHRYLPETHQASLEKIEACGEKKMVVLPLFPQFSFVTTGSIARFFSERLSKRAVEALEWIRSYPTHPAFVRSYQARIAACLKEHNILEDNVVLLFSCHGLPQSYIDKGDIYESECQASFEAVAKGFPRALSRLSYQSKFGKGEWLRPYTDEVCQSILRWNEKRDNVVVVPLSFTSDHIETLYEIEHLYLPLLRERGVSAWRCSALNLEPQWIDALAEIARASVGSSNDALVRY